MLSDAHAARFGVPEPTRVTLTVRPGPCILVSGHDMHDLEAVLKATEGSGVNVYTHGEMLPGHAYPKVCGWRRVAAARALDGDGGREAAVGRRGAAVGGTPNPLTLNKP
jgi:hypothetical protein